MSRMTASCRLTPKWPVDLEFKALTFFGDRRLIHLATTGSRKWQLVTFEKKGRECDTTCWNPKTTPSAMDKCPENQRKRRKTTRKHKKLS